MNRVDLTGQRLGYVVAIRDVGSDPVQRCRVWECICDCGEYTVEVLASRFCKSQADHFLHISCGCMTKTVQKMIARKKLRTSRKGNPDRAKLFGRMTNKEVAEAAGVSLACFKKRLQRGWTAERAMSQPSQKRTVAS